MDTTVGNLQSPRGHEAMPDLSLRRLGSGTSFNPDWTIHDMLVFNRNLIDENVVVCQWVDNGTLCNDPIKGKDFKVHLHHKHGITSESRLYECRWEVCSSRAMKKSTFERHMREVHNPVKWACPYCDHVFTREGTLLAHIERSHGHS